MTFLVETGGIVGIKETFADFSGDCPVMGVELCAKQEGLVEKSPSVVRIRIPLMRGKLL